MVILKMGQRNIFIETVFRFRYLYTKDQLKEKYRFASSLNCYLMARLYLYALYGRKGCYYEYECSHGTIYAYEYPPIRA